MGVLTYVPDFAVYHHRHHHDHYHYYHHNHDDETKNKTKKTLFKKQIKSLAGSGSELLHNVSDLFPDRVH